MVCRNCGNELREGARFCPHCGALNSPDLGRDLPEGAAPYSAYAGPEAPVPGKSKKGLLIGGAVAAAAVIALVAVLAGGLFSSPKGQLEKAVLKSYAAYASVEEKLGMPDVGQWQEAQTVAQRMSLELKSVNGGLVGYDLDALSGLGLYLSADYDGKARKMSFDMGARWGEDDLVSLQMAANDAELYFGSPQFAGETCYGVNTETLGHDLTGMTGDDSMDSLSFNLFDLVDMVLEKVDREAMEKDLREAGRELWEAVQVEKTGKEDLDVKGMRTKADLYLVTIPQDAMEDCADAIIDAMSAADYAALYREMFQAMGLPEEELEGFMSQLEGMDVYGGLSDAVKAALKDLGDEELAVYVGGGYVLKVVYHYQRNDTDLTAALCLGGGEEYVDDLSLELYTDQGRVTVTSTGDHGMKGGAYTDETRIQVRQDNSTLANITSEVSYDPRAGGDNFKWKLGANSSGLSLFALEAGGNLSIGKDAVALAMDDVSLKVMGMEVCNLRFDYSVSNQPRPLSAGDSRLVTEMNMLELMTFAYELQNNAASWASDMETLFESRLPEELLRAIMSGF